ncbi:hypothetical protein C3I27_09855 [Campylobacter jejuni]|uniref:Uncharacterized protein n=1 Tax=Campylobacter jejuni TaxID=197 RepID=A0AAE8KCQ5_CAMJU|nr:hypothetical protein [Campylobacter jejuni]RTH64289.1 hypothetical protein C3I49_08735 [Campylobacter jejuni]RTH73982.1 hypothetical protein C3I47_08720 [Campylobacter jejuni]RTH91034.1 hypothetical protein C3I35_09970 [Campylobacter jejuni]RTI35547.1 hypothetical protein C3I29_08300 [Campylobacter jejuni]RTI43254.1 hypothetical protein C3I26_08615 [Campylobacter jejuni]
MKKPFYKLKRFYMPCGLLIALIIFISLAYRPLELIFWDKYNHEKEYQNAKDTYKLFKSNEEEFKKVFVEQNLNQELKLNQKELLNYMHNFKKDFKFMQILGLDNAYLVALKNKDVLFGLQMQNNLNYFYLASNSTTNLKEINNYLNVADELLVFMSEIEKLPSKYNLGKIMFEFTFVNYNTLFFGFTLDINLMCSIPQKEQLLENMINSYKKMNLLYDINLKTEYQELYETIYGAKKPNRLINFAKGRLNACGI